MGPRRAGLHSLLEAHRRRVHACSPAGSCVEQCTCDISKTQTHPTTTLKNGIARRLFSLATSLQLCSGCFLIAVACTDQLDSRRHPGGPLTHARFASTSVPNPLNVAPRTSKIACQPRSATNCSTASLHAGPHSTKTTARTSFTAVSPSGPASARAQSRFVYLSSASLLNFSGNPSHSSAAFLVPIDGSSVACQRRWWPPLALTSCSSSSPLLLLFTAQPQCYTSTSLGQFSRWVRSTARRCCCLCCCRCSPFFCHFSFCKPVLLLPHQWSTIGAPQSARQRCHRD